MSNMTISARAARIRSHFTVPERILAFFSKDPELVFCGRDWQHRTRQWTDETALSELLSAFPDLPTLIRNKRVIDYGCGDGFQTVALYKAGAAEAIGVDIVAERLEHGRRMAASLDNVSFRTSAVGADADVAISLNAFEHFPDPAENLRELAAAVRPGARILITFGSPWLSPYGAHMNHFTHFPWVHLVFSEKTVYRVRDLYRDDGDRSYVPAMNKMTISKFERVIGESGLAVERLEYRAVRKISFLVHVPMLRELFINRVICVLRK